MYQAKYKALDQGSIGISIWEGATEHEQTWVGRSKGRGPEEWETDEAFIARAKREARHLIRRLEARDRFQRILDESDPAE